MTPRNGSTEPGMDEFASSDAFIEALSRGDDPSGGADPLAAALLELKADIDRPLPPAPQLDAGQSLAGNVASLVAARDAKRKRQLSPWLAGLMGAAAATAIWVGTGATPFDQGVQDDPTVVELAATLDELEVASQRGDEAATRDLLEQARGLVASMKDRQHRAGKGDDSEAVTVTTVTTTVTSTVTTTSSQAPDKIAPEQVPDEPTQAPQTSAQQTQSEQPEQPAQAGQSGQPAQRPSTQPGGTSATGSPTPGSGVTSAPAGEAGTGSNTPAARVQQPAPARGEVAPEALRNTGSS
ncbi:hypothetical protein Q0N48_09050 [Corynebacterium ureicelerivorans]|uniref:hypothetical protein n=1 Tax=Corynebacterium ureicelerivorans TaxID=401472 RepID=UPI00264D9B23|nr:hypothetical protein [Corynebacterium ureicelerivorans]MDN8606140.1 hypothetical protein [Corynebacterium ureicelerivorans]